MMFLYKKYVVTVCAIATVSLSACDGEIDENLLLANDKYSDVNIIEARKTVENRGGELKSRIWS